MDLKKTHRPTILFIQGAGEGAYAEDQKLVLSLQNALGAGYNVRYPKMPEDAPDYEPWKEQIAQELAALAEGVLLAAHSAGGSILLRYLSEEKLPKPIVGLFLIAPPYFGTGGWNADGWNIPELVLQKNFASQITEAVPVFFYHSRDDAAVPFEHLGLYRNQLPQATFREFDGRGHQFDNDLTEVARDIKNLSG